MHTLQNINNNLINLPCQELYAVMIKLLMLGWYEYRFEDYRRTEGLNYQKRHPVSSLFSYKT